MECVGKENASLLKRVKILASHTFRDVVSAFAFHRPSIGEDDLDTAMKKSNGMTTKEYWAGFHRGGPGSVCGPSL